VGRRLSSLVWETRAEVTIVRGRIRGWIDLLAYDPHRRILLVVEVKTWIDDLGSVERQLDWYMREAPAIARDLGWQPTRTVGWVLALATADIDETIRRNRDVIDRAFPGRTRDLAGLLAGGDAAPPDRGIALIDPRNRRRNWLIPSRIDGRRSLAPYRDIAEAARLMSG
jgi:hypothetical protein